jgi:RNA polymerase sigma-70 factor (ECF subfamily)
MKNTQTVNLLFRRISEGDSKAFTQFYELYFDRVYQIAYYYIKDRQSCEEIVSDVFMTVWQSGIKLQSIDNIDSYLFITTRNRAFFYLNQQSNSNVSVDEIPFEALFHNENPEESTVNDEFLRKINEAIETLPERCKQIFLMAREEGLKYREIATALSISEKTVIAQMVTAIKRLAKSLQNYLSIFF